VGLPQLESKAILRFQDSQWVTKAAGTWSFHESLCEVAKGDAEDEREGSKLYFPRQKLKIILEQPTNEANDYRILLVKNFNKASATLDPDEVLANHLYWTYTGYQSFSDRLAGKEKWKVIRDINFNWSTKDGGSERKELFINLPACNVEYDEDIIAGSTNKNALFLFVETNATVSSANHGIRYYLNYKFIDS